MIKALKILWHGDVCCNTGFARVTHSLLAELAKEHEVHVLGINYYGDPHPYPFKIWPACGIGRDRHGVSRAFEVVNKVRPDVFICFNDLWVVNAVWEKVHFLRQQLGFKFVGYFPVDCEMYSPAMVKHVSEWDTAATFLRESVDVLVNSGVKSGKLCVIPHGVDVERFSPMDTKECKKKLGLPEDSWIVLNSNRNQPRKRIDLTIKGFADFAKGKDDTYLYLHMNKKDLGWDVVSLFKTEMERRGMKSEKRLIMTNPNMDYSNAPPDETLNLVYNSCNVAINTSDGEGWGLTPFEAAACRKPVIVPANTASKAIWEGMGITTKIAQWVIDKDLNIERGIVSSTDLAKHLTKLYQNDFYAEGIAVDCYEVTQRDQYRWGNIAENFNRLLESV